MELCAGTVEAERVEEGGRKKKVRGRKLKEEGLREKKVRGRKPKEEGLREKRVKGRRLKREETYKEEKD